MKFAILSIMKEWKAVGDYILWRNKNHEMLVCLKIGDNGWINIGRGNLLIWDKTHEHNIK